MLCPSNTGKPLAGKGGFAFRLRFSRGADKALEAVEQKKYKL